MNTEKSSKSISTLLLKFLTGTEDYSEKIENVFRDSIKELTKITKTLSMDLTDHLINSLVIDNNFYEIELRNLAKTIQYIRSFNGDRVNEVVSLEPSDKAGFNVAHEEVDEGYFERLSEIYKLCNRRSVIKENYDSKIKEGINHCIIGLSEYQEEFEEMILSIANFPEVSKDMQMNGIESNETYMTRFQLLLASVKEIIEAYEGVIKGQENFDAKIKVEGLNNWNFSVEIFYPGIEYENDLKLECSIDQWQIMTFYDPGLASFSTGPIRYLCNKKQLNNYICKNGKEVQISELIIKNKKGEDCITSLSEPFLRPLKGEILEVISTKFEDIDSYVFENIWESDYELILKNMDVKIVYYKDEDNYYRAYYLNIEEGLMENAKGEMDGIGGISFGNRVTVWDGIDTHKLFNLFAYIDRVFESKEEMKADIKKTSEVDINLFFQDMWGY